MDELSENIDVLVIGAGQAGLALGYYLRQTKYSFILTEQNGRIGDSWRNRYDSLVLFTSRRFCALPGLTVHGNPDSYPSKDDIAKYLETYSQHFKLPVQTNVEVQSLERTVDGNFKAVTACGATIYARSVVLATGAFQVPIVPSVADGFSSEIIQFTAETYRSPSQVPKGRVVVVGDGSTGRQIAAELSRTCQVIIATGHSRPVLPSNVFGKDIFWWLDLFGIIRAASDSFLGRKMKRTDSFPGTHLRLSALKKQGIQLVGRLTEARGMKAIFSSGQDLDIDCVVWATGYRDRTDWVAIPKAKNSNGLFLQKNGISPITGMYFIGRSWQSSRGSALLLGVGRDAENIVEHLSNCLNMKLKN
ncbi:flavin-containing monooxygenase [Undibacterium parvum]|uniref:NAD(P)-binding domain-containing protein n=2 Tax=Undibacterium TaxID=401469 RepID=A0A6M4A328_9BURK|nr:NAD(P)/FAD-dependent oxidoreductase [Undibacterium parvum]AZP10917.1 potassium transporter [Undibacterium parvum]QJQ05493.1 NAD(P)-binding domain-containing protein [Undibacterium piscinae]